MALVAALRSIVRSRLELEVEILALRRQLAVLQRQAPSHGVSVEPFASFCVLRSGAWPNWRGAVRIVTPDTVFR